MDNVTLMRKLYRSIVYTYELTIPGLRTGLHRERVSFLFADGSRVNVPVVIEVESYLMAQPQSVYYGVVKCDSVSPFTFTVRKPRSAGIKPVITGAIIRNVRMTSVDEGARVVVEGFLEWGGKKGVQTKELRIQASDNADNDCIVKCAAYVE